MTRSFLCICFALVLLLCNKGFAQELESKRNKVILVTDSVTVLDSLPIISQSLFIRVKNGSWINMPDSIIIDQKGIYSTQFINDTIELQYRVFSYNFGQPIFKKDPRLSTDIQFARENPFNVLPERAQADNLFDFQQLNKQGSISRGLGVGNNQNLVLNSGFNLQLSGRLTDSVELLASMTDNNLPFQPDGYTQQLQDFDRVFVQIRDRKNSLIVGDYDLNRPNSHFLNFFKNVKGARVDNSITALGKGQLKQTASFSAARGQFGRNVFLGREGNQGPYRLTGTNPGEFIVVLAGSERIYIDGELLKRGEQYDYVIDYNTADLTFTPNRLITNQSRIIAEFEYANQAFARSIAYYGADYAHNRLKIGFHTYRESDNRNQPLFQDLTNEQQRFLSTLGDSVAAAAFPSAVESPFDGRQVRYKQIDSLGFSPVYVYSINPDSARFSVSFSLVGQGNGDYIPAVSTANGRVFQWVAPEVNNGDTVRKGTHAAVIRLTAPNRLQMSIVNASLPIDKYTDLQLEGAQSLNDQNLFSDIDNENNQGYALKAKLQTNRPINASGSFKVRAVLDVEWLDDNFKIVQPYRNMEFARDWNVPTLYAEQEERMTGFLLGLSYKDSTRLDYNFKQYLISDVYQGYRQGILGVHQDKNTQAAVAYDVLSSSSAFFEGDYVRAKANIQRKFGKFQAGASYELEDNLVYRPGTDTLAINSFRFDIANLFVSYQTAAFDKISLRYTYRNDLLPFGLTELQETQTGHSYTLATELNRWEDHLFKLTATYRLLNTFETPEQAANREGNYLGQLEYSGNFFKKLLTWSSFYSFSQGQELRREIAYLEVPRGQGNYTWIDYNENGVQELDEFELSFFSDQANYIKIFIPGNTFVATYSNKFNQTLQLNPANVLSKKHWLARFSNLTAFSMEQKNQGDNAISFLNPFDLRLEDTSLVAANGNIRNTLFFNRNSPKFGIDLGYQRNLQRILLANGTETRENTDQNIRLRWNLLQQLNFESLLQRGQRLLTADLFAVRNYNISQAEWVPALNWTVNSKLRLGLKYAYRQKLNNRPLLENENAAESVKIQELGGEINYNLLASSAIRFTFSNINNAFFGDPNSPVGFEMLQGLLPGSNQVWSVSLFRKLSNNLQLNLTYDGRNSENSAVVHTGRVQARLVF
jgi:hypothetical protein